MLPGMTGSATSRLIDDEDDDEEEEEPVEEEEADDGQSGKGCESQSVAADKDD